VNDLITKRPKQAVILAGGKGTRLKPLTNTVPKPMIKFYGKPFLEYLIDQLKYQGFMKVLLLLGYLPDVIVNYFGNGQKFNIAIEYDITDVDNDTGFRIKHAQDKIEPCFLLMYCDNYCPMNFTNMWHHFQKNNTLCQLTAYTNKDQFTRDNLFINDSSIVEVYDRKRENEALSGVDIGYAICKKEVIGFIPDKNVNFEKTVYPILVSKQLLSAYQTNHRYYSIGNHERLPNTEIFLKRSPTILLDRDGVINKKQQKGCYVTKWEKFEWIDGSIEALSLLKKAGYRIIIVTNQAGVARGMMSASDLEQIHNKMKAVLSDHNVKIDAIYVCPHGWDDNCECRKPKPGMLFDAQKDFHLDLSQTCFIGDDERDNEAAQYAGCPFFMVTHTKSLLDIVQNNVLP